VVSATQLLARGELLELTERHVLDLPDALARDAERPPYLVQCLGRRAAQSEAGKPKAE